MVQLNIAVGDPASLGPRLMEAMGRYRYRVFVERLGWKLATKSGLEIDEFDRDDTVYVIARTCEGDIVGSARLLSTDRPYLLGSIFPQLMGGARLPRDRSIWELSRFAAMDLAGMQENGLLYSSSSVAVPLLAHTLRVAAAHEVTRLITVSPSGIERLLRRAGFTSWRVAAPLTVDGHEVIACWIETTHGVLPRHSNLHGMRLGQLHLRRRSEQ